MPSLRIEGARAEVEVPREVTRTLALAAISGIRSMAGPALLARAIRRGDLAGLGGTRFSALGGDAVAPALQALMIGEMVGDKTPFIPSRVSAGPLFGRALSGALVGSSLFVSEGRRGVAGAVLGAAAAVATTFAADGARKAATQGTRLPDPVFGNAEDWLVLLAGRRLLRRD